MVAGKVVTIGGASAFWGDTRAAAAQLVTSGRLNYLVFDFLAETTMALLAMMKAKNPALGYAPDFIKIMAPLLKDCQTQGIRVIANAGGLNPEACAAELRKIIDTQGLNLTVGIDPSEDLLDPESPNHGALPRPDLLCAHPYHGAQGINRVLHEGAHIVVTGRVVDSALALGPLLYEFGWQDDDYDRLAQGSLAGHIIECGAQCTGGNHTDWLEIPKPEDIGFPFVECHENGDFVVTKPADTGGQVTLGTVSEQILYEIGDPTAYQLPDVTCDFSHVILDEDGPDRLWVRGALGNAPPPTLKACGYGKAGYRVAAPFVMRGHQAGLKGRKVAESILARVNRLLLASGQNPIQEHRIEILGDGPESTEVVVRMGVGHDSKEALQFFADEIAQASTGMAPGMVQVVPGKPKVQPRLELETFPIPNPHFRASGPGATKPRRATIPKIERATSSVVRPVPLSRIAFARSGDKGRDANVGVICRYPQDWAALGEVLTAARVGEYLAELWSKGDPHVERHELPGLHAFNFVLKDALEGGGFYGLQADAQGKAVAQKLLMMNVDLPIQGELYADH